MHETRYATIAISLLRKHHPDVAESIASIISDSMPSKTVDDLSALSSIIQSFIEYSGLVKGFHWSHSKDRHYSTLFQTNKSCKTTDLRQLLVAVVVMFYHPERLLNILPNVPLKRGVLKELSLSLNVEKTRLSNDLGKAITYFSSYKDFKENVYKIYDHISSQVSNSIAVN